MDEKLLQQSTKPPGDHGDDHVCHEDTCLKYWMDRASKAQASVQVGKLLVNALWRRMDEKNAHIKELEAELDTLAAAGHSEDMNACVPRREYDMACSDYTDCIEAVCGPGNPGSVKDIRAVVEERGRLLIERDAVERRQKYLDILQADVKRLTKELDRAYKKAELRKKYIEILQGNITRLTDERRAAGIRVAVSEPVLNGYEKLFAQNGELQAENEKLRSVNNQLSVQYASANEGRDYYQNLAQKRAIDIEKLKADKAQDEPASAFGPSEAYWRDLAIERAVRVEQLLAEREVLRSDRDSHREELASVRGELTRVREELRVARHELAEAHNNIQCSEAQDADVEALRLRLKEANKLSDDRAFALGLIRQELDALAAYQFKRSQSPNPHDSSHAAGMARVMQRVHKHLVAVKV